MGKERKAAIDLEQIGEKSLDEINAADFLSALNAGGLTPLRALRIWPEKKKVELWSEPENVGGASVKDVINVLGEKKKLELEKDPRVEDWVASKPAVAPELEIDPRQLIRDPEFIRELAREVAGQLRVGP